MKTVSRTALALALGIAASGTPLLAQASAPAVLAHASAPAARAAAISEISENAYDAAAARARITRGDELLLRGKITAASREYTAAAKMQRAHNVLPTEAMWKLAELHHGLGQSPERTADVLAALALDAERLGDPQVQAKALLEATILYKKAALPEKAHACADRLEQLVASPHLTDKFRQEVQTRIIRK